MSPYFDGYLYAHKIGRVPMEGPFVTGEARRVYSGDALTAYIGGVDDGVLDRGPRMPTDRVSRAYPPWQLI